MHLHRYSRTYFAVRPPSTSSKPLPSPGGVLGDGLMDGWMVLSKETEMTDLLRFQFLLCQGCHFTDSPRTCLVKTTHVNAGIYTTIQRYLIQTQNKAKNIKKKLGRLLSSRLGLMRNRLRRACNIMLHRFGSFHARALHTPTVHEDPRDLGDTNATKEEVDSSETGR